MSELQNKIDVKLFLAEKYARLARVAGSDPKQRQFYYKSTRYRRQAESMQHALKAGATR